MREGRALFGSLPCLGPGVRPDLVTAEDDVYSQPTRRLTRWPGVRAKGQMA